MLRRIFPSISLLKPSSLSPTCRVRRDPFTTGGDMRRGLGRSPSPQRVFVHFHSYFRYSESKLSVFSTVIVYLTVHRSCLPLRPLRPSWIRLSRSTTVTIRWVQISDSIIHSTNALIFKERSILTSFEHHFGRYGNVRSVNAHLIAWSIGDINCDDSTT